MLSLLDLLRLVTAFALIFVVLPYLAIRSAKAAEALRQTARNSVAMPRRSESVLRVSLKSVLIVRTHPAMRGIVGLPAAVQVSRL